MAKDPKLHAPLSRRNFIAGLTVTLTAAGAGAAAMPPFCRSPPEDIKPATIGEPE